MTDPKHPSLRCLSGPRQGTEVPLNPNEPLRLPVRRQGQEVGQVVIGREDHEWFLQNHSPVTVLVDGESVQRTALQHGSEIRIGAMVFAAHLPMTASQEIRAARSSRRISASRDAIVEEPGREGNKKLLKKVGSVFRRKDERHGRLEQLRNERDQLLRDAGRDALGAQGGFGLSDQMFADLVVGRSVAIAPDQLDHSHLERFRERARQLGMLDATIGVLCAELDLPPDIDAGERQIRLATEEREIEEAAHRAMDAARTEDLGDLIDDPAPAVEIDEPAGNGTAAYSVDAPAPRQTAAASSRRETGGGEADRQRQRSGRRRRR